MYVPIFKKRISYEAGTDMAHRFSAISYLIAGLIATIIAPMLSAKTLDTSHGTASVRPLVTGLKTPWAFAETPDGAILITEREGQLLYVTDGQAMPVKGVPEVFDRGQGGLLDVTLANDFAQSRRLFLTYSKRQSGGASTALAAANLSRDGTALENLRDLFVMTPAATGGFHFGSRVVEDADGALYVTIGDRGTRMLAQDLAHHAGTVVRIASGGEVPDDNPFVATEGALPEIYSYGHRNPQGAAFDTRGQLWVVEHGPRGGDEVNLVTPGTNYGWPLIGYGRHYSGAKVGLGTSAPGLAQPAHYWDPSIAPSGMVFYDGEMFPDWRGDALIGSLKFDYISRLRPSGTRMAEVEQISGATTGRVRDIQVAKDGSIWFLSVADGSLYRMARD